MNKTKTYYQPIAYYDDGTNIEWGDIPNELMSFQAFSSVEDCEEWLENNGYDSGDFNIREYHDEDIEGVTIIDSYGDIVEVNEDDSEKDDETADRYFSEDLHAVLEGKMTASEFRRLWGELEYDAINCIINVGNNTIITNQD